MGKLIYNKLIRDGIPEIIQADGVRASTKILTVAEFRQALLAKLVEEARELLESDGDLDERADVAEVLRAIDAEMGFAQEEIELARIKKREKRGGFEKRIFLETTETDD